MKESSADSESSSEQVLIVRQPIFTRDKEIWGYELLLSPESMPRAGESVSNPADFLRFFHQRYLNSGSSPLAGKRLLLSVPSAAWPEEAEVPETLTRCAVSLGGGTCGGSDCAALAGSLRSRGCVVVVDEDLDPARTDLVAAADIIRVSLAGKTPPEVVNIRKKFSGFEGKYLAVDVNSWEAFEGTLALGFSYFQGPFFTLPEGGGDTELPASSVAKLQLLRELANPACEMDELAAVIAGDVSLSYRILKYINSAALGLRNPVKSIQQAVSLLGLDEVRRWALVVVMTDIDATPRGEELSYQSLLRGRFLSQLAESMERIAISPETLFLLGLFSKLDALLSCPMEMAMRDISLDAGLKDALCGKHNEFRDWLSLLDAVESGSWDEANGILGRYDACLTSTAAQYMQASSWAADLMPGRMQ